MILQTAAQQKSLLPRKLFIAFGTFAFVLLLSILLSESASAHGYMESPASRAYMCKDKLNTGCGAIIYEPQSLEAEGNFPESGPADGQIAGAGGFKELNEQTKDRWKKVTLNGGKNTFTWKLTANHVSESWKYYITKKDWDPNKPLTRDALEAKPFCTIDYKGAKPPMNVSHDCDVPTDRSGYHLILGVWEIADTINAFYNVVDVNLVNDGSVPQPEPKPEPQPQPPTAPSKLVSTLQTVKSIVISWLPSTSEISIKQYDVYRDGVLCGSTTHSTFTDDKLQGDKAYTYTIKAIDQNGLASSFSSPLVVRTLKEEQPGGGNNGGGSTLPLWDAKTVYVQGNKVQYNGLEYVAQYWTQNNTPDNSNAWKLTSKVVVDWSSTKAYVGGDQVKYNGVEYVAKWWTMGDKPDGSDVWKKADK
ncbi:lytic polysaccharide monooxygenase [Paenibacillus sp. L3-i20]|uniref:lytic polysaccharide monooxygenase n=1 Tax=Paenibacillus sp. L3-i20 TaxID=2905833 RepID=UPI001EE0270C|nr:lytic polysaccharide monooxygenase [Paenibacillus sp. L3-i20]GKU77903.1 chitin-binding protein [Paenibacillus sp. L3-i20]